MPKKIIVVFIIILIILAGSYYLFFTNKPVSVRHAASQTMVLRETILATGIVESANNANLSFAASGRISRINISKGDLVSQGQTLASLNAYAVSQNAQAAKDARDIALRDRDLFFENYRNDKDAIGGDEQYEIQLRIVNERISQAEANYQASLGNISNYYIRAPFSGTILDIYMAEGEVAGPGTPVLKIADLDDVYFEVQVDQEDFGKVMLGTKAEVELNAYPNIFFMGEVIQLPQYASREMGQDQLSVKIRISEDSLREDMPILLGMRGEAELIVNETPNEVMAYLFDVIYYDENQNPFVWTLDSQNILKQIPVEIGIEGNIYTEILTDLSNHIVVVPSDSRIEIEEGMMGQIQ